MFESVEISSFDLRYECCRLKSAHTEKQLLESILTHGIRDPLQGVDIKDGNRVLLNGFKRIRCARKLGIGIVPWFSLGNDESVGILELLRRSNSKTLTMIEQARLIDELKGVYGMSTSDIALLLEKSKAWVSVRSGIISEISDGVMKQIFNGNFPAYSYLYTVRKFIRINAIHKKEVEEFVRSVSGKGLSVRDIETLATGYFMGSSEIRSQIRDGNIEWGLKQLKASSRVKACCTGVEQTMLKDLEISQRYMQKVICKGNDARLKTSSFHAQANLLAGGILKQVEQFTNTLRGLYDRSGQTPDHILPS